MIVKVIDHDYYHLGLSFKYDPIIVERCREIKNIVGWKNLCFNGDLKMWLFRYEVMDYILRNFKVTVPDEVMERYEKIKESMDNEKNEIQKAKETCIEVDLPLFEYQKTGVNFGVKLKKVMINDDMGLGKSIQAIGIMKYLGLYQVLIICPNSIKSNWQREIEKWTGMKSYIVENIFVKGINIINYEKLLKFSFTNAKGKLELNRHAAETLWELIIIDESHYIKESKSKRTKLVLQLTKKCDRVVLLTGTPILNKPKELITQIDAIGKLHKFGDSWCFLQRYCAPSHNGFGWDFNGASNIEELKTRLEEFTIRRLKKNVLKDLPEKLITTTLLDLPEPDKYEKIENGVVDDLFQSKTKYSSFYKSLKGKTVEERAALIYEMKLNPEFKDLTSETLVKIEKLKQESARQKVIASRDILSNYVENRTKAIIFCTHKKTVQDLHKMYPESVIMTGDVRTDDRMKAIDSFQNDPNVIFFIATMQTAGVGFNLTASSEVVFMELGWTPAEHKQCEDRAWRIGQTNNVTVNYLIMKDTIDEDIIDVLHSKSEVIEGSIGGDLLSKVILKLSK